MATFEKDVWVLAMRVGEHLRIGKLVYDTHDDAVIDSASARAEGSHRTMREEGYMPAEVKIVVREKDAP